MNRDKALEFQDHSIIECERVRGLVASILLNTPVLITYNTHIRIDTVDPSGLKHTDWEEGQFGILIEPYAFNIRSMKCRILAIEKHGLYPFLSGWLRNIEHAIRPEWSPKYVDIKSWKAVPQEELPLYMGYEISTQLFSAYLKGII